MFGANRGAVINAPADFVLYLIIWAKIFFGYVDVLTLYFSAIFRCFPIFPVTYGNSLLCVYKIKYQIILRNIK